MTGAEFYDLGSHSLPVWKVTVCAAAQCFSSGLSGDKLAGWFWCQVPEQPWPRVTGRLVSVEGLRCFPLEQTLGTWGEWWFQAAETTLTNNVTVPAGFQLFLYFLKFALFMWSLHIAELSLWSWTRAEGSLCCIHPVLDVLVAARSILVQQVFIHVFWPTRTRNKHLKHFSPVSHFVKSEAAF